MQNVLREIYVRIDDFIVRIYRLKALEGAVLVLITGLVGFLFLGAIEYLTWSSSGARLAMWYGFITVLSVVLLWRVIIPFLQSMGIVLRMSQRKAAYMLTAELPELRDQLINVLDLGNVEGGALLIAAIRQKSDQLAALSFLKAIRKDQLYLFLKINLSIAGIWALLLFFDIGSALIESGSRVVNYNTHYEKPAPFQWVWDNKNVEVKHNDGVTLYFSTKGDVVPENGQILLNGQSFPLRRESNAFTFEVPRVKERIDFIVQGSGVRSQQYVLTPMFYPGITGIHIDIIPPAYTGLDVQSSTSGNITIPAGSKVKWNFQTRHTGLMYFSMGDIKDSIYSKNQQYGFEHRLLSPGDYSIRLINTGQGLEVDQQYTVQILPDRLPAMEIDWLQDESAPDFLSAFGVASDDYGLRNARLQYNAGNGFQNLETIPGNNRRQMNIRFSVDINDERFPRGKEIVFRVAVTDNDAPVGGKTAYSSVFSLRKLSDTEREEKRKTTISRSGSAVEQFERERSKQREESRQIMDKRKGGDPLQFKDEEQLRDLMKKEAESLEKAIEALEELQKELKKSGNEQDEERAERIEEQKSELEKLKEEIKELLEKNKPEEMLKKAEEIQKKMDERQRELKTELKQTERMENMRDLLKQIDEMRQMAEDMGGIDMENDESVDEMQERLEQWEKDTEKALDKFPEMQDILKEKDFEQQKEDLKKELGDGKKSDDKQKKQDAKDKSKKKMDKMQQDLMDAFMQMQSDAAKENLEDLRQLLRNVLILSFEQEGISEESQRMSVQSSLLAGVVERQQKMQTASAHVLDSLYALAERVPEIKSKVRTEALRMIERMQLARKELQEDDLRKFSGNMKGAMEHSNELALLLDAILQQMMEDMSEGMSGDQNCQKPGKGQPDISDLLDMQKGLGEQTGQDEDGSQEDGRSEDGNDGKEGDEAKESGEAARRLQMMMRQEEIRKGLSELLKQKGDDGSGKELMDMMEEQEKDIILGKAKHDLIMRQKEIEIRLLELEKAMREQDDDEQREAETAEEKLMPANPHEAYLRRKMQEIERLQRSPFRFKPYYEEKRRLYLEHTQ
jgi:hypothetical protein